LASKTRMRRGWKPRTTALLGSGTCPSSKTASGVCLDGHRTCWVLRRWGGLMQQIEKALTEQQRLERLLAQQEASVQRAFQTFLRNTQSPALLSLVRTQLEQGNVAGALSVLDTHVVRFANIIPQVFEVA